MSEQHVMRQKVYVNADPEETIGATGFSAQTMSLHDVVAFKVVKNQKHHLPRDDDVVFIDVALKTPEGERPRGFTLTLYADKGVQL